MKPILISLIAILFSFETLSANTVKLTGILLDKVGGSPIAFARVWIPGSNKHDTTDQFGEFLLDIGNSYSPGQEIELYISSEGFGFHRQRVVITSNSNLSIEIERNNIVGIFGTVKDHRTGDPLKNIKVDVASEGFAHPDRVNLSDLYTNEYGRFQILLPKDAVGNVKYVRLAFKDESGKCYKYKENLLNISSYLEIELENAKCNSKVLKVRSYTPNAMEVRMGDQIKIIPSGSMRVGTFVGTSTPKGKEGGVLGLSLEDYSIFGNIPHAALLYKFSWEPRNAWKYCGEPKELIIQQDGYLEFQVNDRQQQDNVGGYDVEVSVSKM